MSHWPPSKALFSIPNVDCIDQGYQVNFFNRYGNEFASTKMQANKAAFYYNVIKWSLNCHKQLINLGIVSSFPPILVLPVCKSRSDILWELWLYIRPDFIVTSVNSISQSQLTPGCVSVLKLFVGLLLCDLVT